MRQSPSWFVIVFISEAPAQCDRGLNAGWCSGDQLRTVDGVVYHVCTSPQECRDLRAVQDVDDTWRP